MANEERKREIVLAPGTYAFIQEGTSGRIKTHTGPTSLTLTQQDKPVHFNPKTHQFDECDLGASVQQNVVAPEGWYVVLTNPVKDDSGKDRHPETGRPSDTPTMLVGQKENLAGPVDFALYPGQTAEVRRGHHLRLNEYLRIKVYNADKAKKFWTKAVVQTVDSGSITPSVPTSSTSPTQPAGEGGTPLADGIKTVAQPDGVQTGDKLMTKEAPEDLAIGKQYNWCGTEVSFYIPPTGISVVPDESGVFVRDAETLEQLEYAILVDEDGNKAYPRGPMVVFPRPTQRFLSDAKGNRKFRAIEMNELQGIQLKFIADVKLTFADGTVHEHKAGEEVFITGKEMPIYYPEEGHQLVKYDGKTIHYAVAIPEGEARYVMDRKTGAIRTVRGPSMLLPDPVNEIIVRRALSDSESSTWFPGPTGDGSADALAYNRWLRDEASKEPTTRQGVVSEGRVSPVSGGGFGAVDEAASYFSSSDPVAVGAIAMNYAGSSVAADLLRSKAGAPKMAESRQGKAQEGMLGDVAERKSTFNEPRTITFASKYKGVPTIKLRQGYAISIAEVDGNRRVVIGPKTALLDYGQTLDVLTLSTGKPKNTDKLLRTAYLNVANNKVTDVVSLETSDHVRFAAKLIYNVNFDGDPKLWFSIENYVKYLCDRLRSTLKGGVLQFKIEEFYANSTEILRTIVLGAAKDGAARPGFVFPENGMKVSDVEVLGVEIQDQAIAQLLTRAQVDVVQTTITLNQAQRKLEATMRQEEITQQEAEAKSETAKHLNAIKIEEVTDFLALTIKRAEAEEQKFQQDKLIAIAREAVTDIVKEHELERDRLDFLQQEATEKAEFDRKVAFLKAEVEAAVTRFGAAQGGFSEALLALQNHDTLIKVAEAMSVQSFIGGKTLVDVLDKVFEGTPLKGIIETVKKKTLPANGQQQPVA